MSNATEKPSNITNPELIMAMGLLKSESNDENMLKVLTAAVPAKFILPVEGEIGAKVRFHAVTGSDGKIYQVVYADTYSFNQAFGASNQNGIVAGFMDLADLVVNQQSKVDGFVINPGKEEIVFGKEMISAVVAQLISEGAVPGANAASSESGSADSASNSASTDANGITKTQMTSSSNVMVGDPEELPEGLGNATIELGASFEEIFKITIQLMQYEGDDKPKWLFIVDHNGDSDEIFGYLGKAVGPYLEGLEIVMTDGDSPFGKQAATGKIPVYAK